jgi:hypothetical protein
MDVPHHFLAAIREQPETADAPVKAAALLHLARVLAVDDRDEAQRVLERGIALVMDFPAPDGPPLLRQAVYLAATVSPQRAFQLVPFVQDPYQGGVEGAIFTMLDHGHVADAVSYLSAPADGSVSVPCGRSGNWFFPAQSGKQTKVTSRSNTSLARQFNVAPVTGLRTTVRLLLEGAHATGSNRSRAGYYRSHTLR